jgi:hypothetical protein
VAGESLAKTPALVAGFFLIKKQPLDSKTLNNPCVRHHLSGCGAMLAPQSA